MASIFATKPAVSNYTRFKVSTKYQTTIGDFIDNIGKNGFKHIHGTLYTYEDGEIIGACALGQGILNTVGSSGAKRVHSLEEALNKAVPNYTPIKHVCRRFPRRTQEVYGITGLIIHMNDHDEWSLKKIANALRKQYADKLNVPVKYEVWE